MQDEYKITKKDIDELKWENRIQTIAVLLVFFWGINTVRDLTKSK
jgi:hypothetical protein